MLFNSLEFLIFFPLVTFLFFVLPHKIRWTLLLTASCIFYMFFKIEYILILFFTIIIDYFAGILLEKERDPKRKKYYLIVSIISNIGVLAIFKYFNFLNENVSGLFNLLGKENPIPNLNILLPIGLSFHTFQAMSYTFEVYRGNQKAEKNFGIYALYVMFYPQLVAGPIERPQNMLPQFYEKKYFSYENVTNGLKLMLWGFFKKIVIADRLAVLVSTVYGQPENYTGTPLIIATFFFSFQIYCDFSGYTDIAIGAAKVMGFDLMKNFNRPYAATSISEFWTRWHISLSTWFKDYLYIPLGGNRVKVSRLYFNLFLVFLISGLWHGANWTYIIWGAIHGSYLIFALITKNIRQKINDSLKLDKFGGVINVIHILITFALVSFAWIFFRAESLNDAIYISTHLFKNIKFQMGGFNMGLERSQFFIGVVAILALLLVEFWSGRDDLVLKLNRQHKVIRWICYYFISFVILMFANTSSSQFIYFQF